MISPTLRTFLVNVAFSAVVALSFNLYGQTFRRLRPEPVDSLAGAARFVFTVLFDPYFVAGLLLALAGSVLRIVLMRWLGIARTALASELSLIFSIVFAYWFFGSTPRFPRDWYGAALILAGSYLVAS